VREPLWLSKEFILALHERLISQFGGLAGIRDDGLLESALGKPVNLFAYSDPGIFDLVAAYAFRIVENHPFLDGNKRAGFAAAAVFLETNGCQLTAGEVEATTATLALAEGTLSEEGYAGWLTEHSTTRTEGSKAASSKRVKKGKRE
jgi:death-on-curing protein